MAKVQHNSSNNRVGWGAFGMRDRRRFVVIIGLICGSVVGVATQQIRRQGGLDIVEVIGCLASGPNGSWVLMKATEPVVSTSASTSIDAVKAAASKPLGTQKYVLLGVATNWNPPLHKDHKMAVKGFLLKASGESRINVTSFQMVSTAGCGS